MTDPLAALRAHEIPICRNGEGWHVDSGAAAVYEPATDEMVAWAEGNIGRPMPRAFVAFLQQTNGLYVRDLVIFGADRPLELSRVYDLESGRDIRTSFGDKGVVIDEPFVVRKHEYRVVAVE
jgi:hypothetical protein